jgi:hypothetical protein
MPSSGQTANAQIIINTGSSLGANSKQLLAAIEAALVESNLINVGYGDRDSRGLFQQRPSQGWGSQSQVMDPYYAANAFFRGAGTNKGALQVSQSGTAGQLAQRVQRSAFPARYDARESEALDILSRLGMGGTRSQGSADWWGATGAVGGDSTDDAIYESGETIQTDSVPAYGSYEEYLAATSNNAPSATNSLLWIILAVVGVLVVDNLVNE